MNLKLKKNRNQNKSRYNLPYRIYLVMQKLEREATNYMEAKREQFKSDLNTAIKVVDKFLLDNLEDNSQRRKARDKLLECKMWAGHSYTK